MDAAFRLVFSGWTHSASGGLPNGTSDYANTKLNPNVTGGITTNSAHLSVWTRTDSGGAVIAIGTAGASPVTVLHVNTSTSANSGNGIANADTLGGIAFSTGVTSTANKFQAVSRLSSSTQKLFINGALNATGTATSIAPPNAEIFIGAQNNGGGTAQLWSDQEIAFASIGGGLTDAEMSAFYTAVAAFQTALSR